ncbi:LAME_0G17942g1_1 [Lachancea meyersii CBS 8951]|uniref:Sulfite reductase [NADPH] subunit beta n=1 Tax=Lachancea meyersii CBS 8951 TaxID=1266667 RepID=A0A1G4KBP2_9SACH|nr:LAME_0G17942g1_1 [Lachancea meyersii CBS 8951]
MAELSAAQLLANVADATQGDIYYTTQFKAAETGVSAALQALQTLRVDQESTIARRCTQLLNGSDPFAAVVEGQTDGKLASVFTDEITLVRSVPHLQALQNTPVVVTVELGTGEYAAVPLVKELAFATLVSTSSTSLARHAVAAAQSAAAQQKLVFHFVDLNAKDMDGKLSAQLAEATEALELTNLAPFTYHSSAKSPSTLVVNLSPYAHAFAENLPAQAALLDIHVYRPWSSEQFFQQVPESVQKIVIVQRTNGNLTASGFEPVLLDFFADFNTLVARGVDQLLVTNVGELGAQELTTTLQQVVDNARAESPDTTLFIGRPSSTLQDTVQLQSAIKGVFSLEDAYLKVLRQLFDSNLQILNQFQDPDVNATSPEYGFGLATNQNRERQRLCALVEESLEASAYPSPDASRIVELLAKWLRLNDNERSRGEVSLEDANKIAADVFELLQLNQDSSVALKILKLAPTVEKFKFASKWLIGSDAWSYDLGNSGVHHVLSSKLDVNMLIIDSEPYEHVKNSQSKLRKKDVGLYALNFGTAYVASVAVYSSYTQLLTAFIEAAKFPGPSIVLAYLPYSSERDTPLDILKQTKIGVESGYWPLYRYNPQDQNPDNAFKLESSVIRRQLQDFLDRENKLTLLTRKSPELARNLKQGASGEIEAKQLRRANAAYDQLLEGLSGPPLHIYYASDGGNATNLAKRLGSRATSRGLKATVLSMDNLDFETFADEENVVFITSTAGQGEFPQDGKAFWDQLKASLDLDLVSLNFSVFGLGDSLYWPRKEDKHYYNKPAKDLFKKLELLSAKPLASLGLGDDQDADGYQTGYSEWEPQLWESLGVSGAAVLDEPKPITNEDIKIESNFLRGTITEALNDNSTGAISASDQQVTKFHGIYMQDDRDIRDTRKAQGLEPYYIFMSRVRLPGGKASPEQWLVLDKLADKTGNGTIKITTRATFQLHGVVKSNLKHTIRAMNSTLMDTLAACGDVNRNVMVSALPANAKVHKQASDIASRISEYLLPQTTAYHEIWLEGADKNDENPNWPSIFENRKEGPNKKKTLVSGNALVDVEPMYGPTYLPRKFKINMTVPPFNDVDVWSIDVGLIAIVDQESQIIKGFNLYVGGGMGCTHNNKKTYPRTGSSLGFVSAEDVHIAIEKVLLVQRDNGDRENRKHARLKYTVDDLGVDVYRQKVEEIWGKKFGPEQPYEIKSNIDYFGWVKDETGKNHFTIFIENGRVENSPDLPQKTGLKKVAEYMQETGSGHFRLTGNQHVVISDITDEHLAHVKSLLKKYKLDNTNFSGLRLSSAACVALPTCGLAMAESERYLPVLITKLEDILEQYGLRHDSIVMRMTGCPNGCSRPWLAEIACVGKAPGTYNLMLGGGYYGQRLNKLYRASVKEDEIIAILKPMFKNWSLHRQEGEHFGDFLVRTGVIKPTLEGRYFHDDIPQEAL